MNLPRAVEKDPRAAQIKAYLEQHAVDPGIEGSGPMAEVSCTDELARTLRWYVTTGAVVRGLETATQTLIGEANGMAEADARSGASRGARVSRLLILANDGSRRFFRDVATLTRYHADRLLVLKLEVSGDELGELAFGRQVNVRALLVTQKDAVANLLFSLAETD